MNTLAPKLVLTPLLIASTSLAGRRWGATLSGWLVALPLTSGPIALFIALDLGPRTAIEAAGGALVGAIGQVAFAGGYALASRRFGWRPALATGAAAFAVVGVGVPSMAAPVVVGVLLLAIAAFLRMTNGEPRRDTAPVEPPAWDTPARVVVATALVLGISAGATVIGGRASGILATFPVYIAVLTTFAHANHGRPEAVAVLRGLSMGLVGFAAFFVTLGTALTSLSIWPAFALSLIVGLGAQAATLPVVGARLRLSGEP